MSGVAERPCAVDPGVCAQRCATQQDQPQLVLRSRHRPNSHGKPSAPSPCATRELVPPASALNPERPTPGAEDTFPPQRIASPKPRRPCRLRSASSADRNSNQPESKQRQRAGLGDPACYTAQTATPLTMLLVSVMVGP